MIKNTRIYQCPHIILNPANDYYIIYQVCHEKRNEKFMCYDCMTDHYKRGTQYFKEVHDHQTCVASCFTRIGMETMGDWQKKFQTYLSSCDIQRKPKPLQVEQKSAQVEQNSAQVEQNSAQVEQNSAQVEQNSAQVEQNSAQVEQNSAQVEQKSAQVEQNSAQVEQKSAQVEQNSAQVEQNSAQVEQNSAQVEQNSNFLQMEMEMNAREILKYVRSRDRIHKTVETLKYEILNFPGNKYFHSVLTSVPDEKKEILKRGIYPTVGKYPPIEICFVDNQIILLKQDECCCSIQ